MAKLRLLFVEDEPDIKDVVTIALGLDPTIDLVSFDSGVAALAAIDAGAGPFQHGLFNLRLPTMTGIELHQTLRRHRSMAELTTVLITAAIQTIKGGDLAQSGIAGAIAKPFDPLTLAATVKALFWAHASGKAPRIVQSVSLI